MDLETRFSFVGDLLKTCTTCAFFQLENMPLWLYWFEMYFLRNINNNFAPKVCILTQILNQHAVLSRFFGLLESYILLKA